MKKRYVKTSVITCIILFVIMALIASILVLTDKTTSASFKNKVIFIDPGHGGKDNGTSYNDIYEDELNMKISSILYEKLLDDGYSCYLTRVSDYDLSSPYASNHKLEDLNKRIEYMKMMKADIFVSMHLNYYQSGNVNGLQVFHQKNKNESKHLSEIMQKNLNNLNKKSKKNKVGDYYILNNAYNIGVLIEYGFLSSEYDRKLLSSEKHLNKICDYIILSINEYFIAI